MSGNDSYSGWGGDDKGAPMVVVTPGGGGGGGSSRTTVILLVTAMVFALGLAGYSMWRLDQSTREHKTAITELGRVHGLEVKAMEEKLGRARASLLEDKDYAEQLEADNLSMKTRGRPLTVLPPRPPERQKYINELQQENAQRRTPGRVVRETPKRNVWPDGL